MLKLIRSATTARTFVRHSITALCTAWSLLVLWTFLCLLVYLGLRHPALDQFRLYPIYLEQSFPANVVQIENGHRPVLPSIVRVAEIHLTDADQTLQLAIGALAALALAFAGALVHRRFDKASAASTAIALLAGCFGVFWMANSRMLLHGNESVHAYFAGGFSLLAFLIAWRASQRRCLRCLTVALACATAAGLSFGPGVAAFGLILIAPIIAGNWRFFLIGLGYAAAFAIGYLFLLPQGENARSVIAFDLPVLLDHLGYWLGSALVHAGLGANPSAGLWQAPTLALTPLGALSDEPYFSWTLHGATYTILALTLYSSYRAWRDSADTPRLVIVGIGLSWFAFGAGLLVCLARSDYLTVHTDQKFADRYLLWSCFYFLGAWFQIQGRLTRTDTGLMIATAALIGVGWIMRPGDRVVQGWALAFHHTNERMGAAMLGDVDSPELYLPDGSASEADRVRTVALFREHRLGVFAGPERERISRFRAGEPPTDLPVITMVLHREFDDRRHGPTKSITGQFPLDADVPVTALLTTPSQGRCGILRRVANPVKPKDIWKKPGGGFHLGMTGFTTCRAPETVTLWSIDEDTPQPIARLSGATL